MRKRSSLCLAMLVRDEAEIIARCLQSVRPLIDRYCVIDTGSTDNTIDIIQQTLSDIPGEITTQPFSAFYLLRNQLFQAAATASDYVLMLDADESVVMPEQHDLNLEALDIGIIETGPTSHSYMLPRVFKASCQFEWHGHVFESIKSIDDYHVRTINELRIHHHQDGYRWRQPRTIENDVVQLMAELNGTNEDADRLLHLGQLYFKLGQADNASWYLKQSVERSDQIETQWQAYYWNGQLLMQYEPETSLAVDAFMQAYDLCPDRVEPLVHLVTLQQQAGNHEVASKLADVASRISVPTNVGYFERPRYSAV